MSGKATITIAVLFPSELRACATASRRLREAHDRGDLSKVAECMSDLVLACQRAFYHMKDDCYFCLAAEPDQGFSAPRAPKENALDAKETDAPETT